MTRYSMNPADEMAAEDKGGDPKWQCWSKTSVTTPGCGQPVNPLCDVQQVANVVRGTASGAPGTMTLAPIRSNYFQALACRMWCVDGTNPDTNRRCEIQQIEINSFPQEAFSNIASAAANTSAVLVDSYITDPGLGWGVPVGWGIFAQASLIHILNIGFVSIEPAGVTLDLYASAYGNALDVVPPGYSLGKPFL